jgi:DNA-binding transcriptional MocR family regulator
MRINFSFSNKEEIETGVKRLSEVIGEELAGQFK